MTKRILYLDDELDLLEIAATFFEEEGIPIEACSDFHKVLELIRNNQYDLIISDAKLPSGSGYELRRILREERMFLGKFILVTGQVEQLNPDEKSQYDLIIYKPIRFHELVLEVKKLLLV